MSTRKIHLSIALLCACVAAGAPSLAGHGESDRFDEHKVNIAFQGWLAAFMKEAEVKGISQKTIRAALDDIRLNERVIALDRNQPESKLNFSAYLAQIVNNGRIAKGRAIYAKNKDLIDEISRKYEIPPRYIMALWAIESDYGRKQGRFNVIEVLVTLAYDGRRPDFFREELLNALRIVDRGLAPLDSLKGSWAGAMGQTQFMPSTFLNYAVDHTGDGQIDIWDSHVDALASGANYLNKAGWRPGETWGREVTIPNEFDATLLSLDVQKTIGEWQSLGVRRTDGNDLPGKTKMASLIQVGDKKIRYFLVYDNFRVIREWNRSNNFALSVGMLANSYGF